MEIKICGITREEDAEMAAALGVDALGFVFYPRSPRFVEPESARRLVERLCPSTAAVGVFVDEPWDEVRDVAQYCGLRGVQLHGEEAPEDVERLRRSGLIVIKALFINKAPGLEAWTRYRPSAFLVECAGKALPGGNALSWDWASARGRVVGAPLVLAGGLNPENVETAVRGAQPDAVDVSSGVEARPGIKDPEKMRRFVEAVRNACGRTGRRRIFS